jgi:Holliday junction resolvasome RuvABC ATP-dependent DNA helicase subunit
MKINILGWRPSRWADIIGNQRLKETLRNLVRKIRVDGERRVTRLLIESPSRTGKTIAVRLFGRAMQCKNLDLKTLDPCGKCESCRRDPEDFGDTGLFSILADCEVHFLSIDCTKLPSPKEINDILWGQRGIDGTRIVFLDEIHRLQHRALDEQFMKPVEEKEWVWIAAAADVSKLEQMFLNRFVKLKTELPGKEEMCQWLIDRCQEFRIAYEARAIMELAKRPNRVPGIALQALDYVSLYEDGLTLKRLHDWQPSTE